MKSTNAIFKKRDITAVIVINNRCRGAFWASHINTDCYKIIHYRNNTKCIM